MGLFVGSSGRQLGATSGGGSGSGSVSVGTVTSADYTIDLVGSTVTAYPRSGSVLSLISGTDAYTVIQGAITALTTAGANGTGGGLIYINKGTYTLSNELTITGWEAGNPPTSSLVIVGSGNSTRLRQLTSGKNLFLIRNKLSLTLASMFLEVGPLALSVIRASNGGTSEISIMKGKFADLNIYSTSTSQPAVYLQNFFALRCDRMDIYSTVKTSMRLENISSNTNYGNSEFSQLNVIAPANNAEAGLHIYSTNGRPMNLNKFNSLFVGAVNGYGQTNGRGIVIEGGSYNQFEKVDVEYMNNPIVITGTDGVRESTGNDFTGLYVYPSDAGTAINCNIVASGNTFDGHIEGDNSNIQIITDTQQYRPANKYNLTVGPSLNIATKIAITEPDKTWVFIDQNGSDTVLYRLPALTTAKTQTVGNNTTSIATTAFVTASKTPVASLTDVMNSSTIACWGDSLTDGLGINTWLSEISGLTGFQTFNGGVGGETSTQIKNRMVAATDKYGWPTIIWAGRNNLAAPTTVKADIATMVAALGHTRYLVFGITPASDETVGTGTANTINQLNIDLAAIYGVRFVDIKAYLLSKYNSGVPQDVTDFNNSILPSTLRTDAIHLNRLGNYHIGQVAVSKIQYLRSADTTYVSPSAIPSFQFTDKQEIQLAPGGRVMIGGRPFVYAPIQNDINNYNSLVIGDGGTKLNPNTATGNTFVGFNAGKVANAGNQNTLIGSNVGALLTSGSMNTGVGQHALSKLTTNTSNTAIGWAAGFNTTGAFNVFIGVGAGQTLGNANGNIFIGYNAANAATTTAGSIAIGNNIALPSNTTANQLVIGNVIFGQGVSGNGTTKAGTIGIRINATTTAILTLPASTTTEAPLNIAAGTAPTTPQNGDIWTEGTDLKIRLGGTTYTITKA